jgi:hypothetical protein
MEQAAGPNHDLLAAGFDSVESAQRALSHLIERREGLVDDRLSASSIGGDDLGGGMRGEAWRGLNNAIDQANSLGDIEERIAKLQVLLASSESGTSHPTER